nr:MerR family transcriptional regulator [Anaerolineaceae bacterium]
MKTSEIAKIIGVHPNTIRLYEEWGYLPLIPRAKNGYRIFNKKHVEQMRLARLGMSMTWLGGTTRRLILTIIFSGAKNDLDFALEQAFDLKRIITKEKEHAISAIRVLEQWAENPQEDQKGDFLLIGSTASLLDISIDQLRNWERNGLLCVPRNPKNGYRTYGSTEISRLKVIRALLKARYSTMSVLRML